jgi:hypothetical protein
MFHYVWPLGNKTINQLHNNLITKIVENNLYVVAKFGKLIMWNHRSRETRIDLVFQFTPEKLGRFETAGWSFLVF